MRQYDSIPRKMRPVMTHPRFHLAFPVRDLSSTRTFYGTLLGCLEGRSSDTWIDFDFFGHQIVAHLDTSPSFGEISTSQVDGKNVPQRHFGLILEWPDWEALADRLRSAELAFIIEPYIRFEGEAGEQGTFFICDPSGNALEFKTFRDEAQIFARSQFRS